MDMDLLCIDFIFTGNTIHPTADDLTPFYRSIVNDTKLTNTEIFKYPRGQRYISSYAQYAVHFNKDFNYEVDDHATWALKYIHNDTLKGYYLIGSLKYLTCYDDKYITFMDNYRKYFATEYLKEKLNAHEATIKVYGKGEVALDFKAKDIEGKEYKLSDFKGKLVYIDVWATWCGPCKDEIPHFKTIEKKYKGKNIEFIKLSFDAKKDDWEKWINEKPSKGLSLHMEKHFKSDLAKAYGINAIPRFILIDQNGKIVSTDAPRPSNKALKDMLDTLLK
jgi:thiol-disulfide isomerase/thioredoxin